MNFLTWRYGWREGQQKLLVTIASWTKRRYRNVVEQSVFKQIVVGHNFYFIFLNCFQKVSGHLLQTASWFWAPNFWLTGSSTLSSPGSTKSRPKSTRITPPTWPTTWRRPSKNTWAWYKFGLKSKKLFHF